MVSYGWKAFVGESFMNAIRLARISTPGASESTSISAHVLCLRLIW